MARRYSLCVSFNQVTQLAQRLSSMDQVQADQPNLVALLPFIDPKRVDLQLFSYASFASGIELNHDKWSQPHRLQLTKSQARALRLLDAPVVLAWATLSRKARWKKVNLVPLLVGMAQAHHTYRLQPTIQFQLHWLEIWGELIERGHGDWAAWFYVSFCRLLKSRRVPVGPPDLRTLEHEYRALRSHLYNVRHMVDYLVNTGRTLTGPFSAERLYAQAQAWNEELRRQKTELQKQQLATIV